MLSISDDSPDLDHPWFYQYVHQRRKFRKEEVSRFVLFTMRCDKRKQTKKFHDWLLVRVYKPVSCQHLHGNFWSGVNDEANLVRFVCFCLFYKKWISADSEFTLCWDVNIFVSNKEYFQTKIECSTSEKGTCRQPFCYFTKNGTDTVLANYGCKELTKPLDKIIVRKEKKNNKLEIEFLISFTGSF